MRLFLSVDLVGSTAFKDQPENIKPAEGSFAPLWVGEFQNFYQEFPKTLNQHYAKFSPRTDPANLKETDGGGDDEQRRFSPRVWKAVGDELIFCCRVQSIEHTVVCVSAFLQSLASYKRQLATRKLKLSVKGTGWLAAFPAPNITINLTDKWSNPSDSRWDSDDERTEAKADDSPHAFDFLGKGIDTGFRVARWSGEAGMSISVQLALILARAAQRNLFPYAFRFSSRESLKGVVADLPYPRISIVTETDPKMLTLMSREDALMGAQNAAPQAIYDFLEVFMAVAAIEKPYLYFEGEPPDSYPPSYSAYIDAHKKSLEREHAQLEPISQMGEIDPSNAAQDGSVALKAEEIIKKARQRRQLEPYDLLSAAHRMIIDT